MTAPGRYAADDGSFAKSAGGAAARGGVLIAIALIIGVALLAWGFDGGDADATLPVGNDDDDSTDDTTDSSDQTDTDADADNADGDADVNNDDVNEDDPTTTEPTDTVALRPPSDVQVAVFNGANVGGLAGERSGVLGALGYVVTAGNASASDVEASAVYYTSGFAEEAKQVAEALSGDASVLQQVPADPASLASEGGAADAAAADIIVVLGTDEQLR